MDNSIDTKDFRAELDAVREEQMDALRRQLGIERGAPVGLFCGSLYEDKRLDLLVAAADIIKERMPTFHMVVIGNGPRGSWFRAQVTTRPWMHMVGEKHATEKATYFRLARVILNPGAVGLLVSDAFTAGLPMITTATARHGPEIVYLQNGDNGLIVGDSPMAYAEAVLALLSQQETYERVAANALTASQRYTVENMARNFAEGILRCLNYGSAG